MGKEDIVIDIKYAEPPDQVEKIEWRTDQGTLIPVNPPEKNPSTNPTYRSSVHPEDTGILKKYYEDKAKRKKR